MSGRGGIHGTTANQDELGFMGWWSSVPVVTRSFLAAFVFFVLGGRAGVVQPRIWLMSWAEIVAKKHFWRPFFTMFMPGGLSFETVIILFFFYKYSSQLERNVFLGVTADYVWFFACAWLFLLPCTLFVAYPIWGEALIFAVLQLWSMHNKTVQMSFFGFFQYPGAYFAISMIALSFVRSGGALPIPNICGLAAGHLYYYLTSILPTLPGREGMTVIRTPAFVTNFFESYSVPAPPPPGSSAAGRAAKAPPPAMRIRNGQIVDSTQQSTSSSISAGISSMSTKMRSGYSWGSGQTLGES